MLSSFKKYPSIQSQCNQRIHADYFQKVITKATSGHFLNGSPELFHNATALRGINGPHDVQQMPQVQRDLALRSIQIAQQGLDITVNSPAYREGMKYGKSHIPSLY